MNKKTNLGIIMAAIFTIGFTVTACRPDPKDGIYQPKKHISNIIMGLNFSDTAAMQIWYWRDNLLRSIDHHLSYGIVPSIPSNTLSTERFFYENNRLTHIVLENTRSNFIYDGDNLSQVVITTDGKELMRFTLAYKKAKLSSQPLKTTFGISISV